MTDELQSVSQISHRSSSDRDKRLLLFYFDHKRRRDSEAPSCGGALGLHVVGDAEPQT